MNMCFPIILSSTDKDSSNKGITESLVEVIKNPIFYIVIGAVVLLCICIYLLSRFVKAKPNFTTIVVRKKRVYKVINESCPSYYLVPFVDKIGAVISQGEQEFSSNKLFINNGPDALYRIDYTLNFKVSNPAEHYYCINSFLNRMPIQINDALRDYADQGNALSIVRDYRVKEKEILCLLNNACNQYCINIVSFKVNFIEPLGSK